MFSFIKKELLKRHKNRTVEFVKLRGGGKGKILLFAFFDNENAPSLCLKLSSSLSFNSLIKSEFDSLKSARNVLPIDLRKALPEPYDLFEVNGYLVSSEKSVIGRQISFNASKSDLKNIFIWLCNFHKHNIIERKIITKRFLIEELKINDSIEEIWWNKDIEVPLIRQHGDFHFANTFFQGGLLKVVDWANYGNVVLPGYDLLFFLRRQGNGIESNSKLISDYFDFFSMPKEIIPSWIKLINVIEGLEKSSQKNG